MCVWYIDVPEDTYISFTISGKGESRYDILRVMAFKIFTIIIILLIKLSSFEILIKRFWFFKA